MPRYVLISLAALFAFAGLAVACVDLRDHKTVPDTEKPASIQGDSDPDPLTINEAKREVQVIVDDTNRWIEWRNADIAKEEAKVAFIEGAVSGGLESVAGTIGAAAGPFAPLAALLIGYATKRRRDMTPGQVAKEKQDSFNKGHEVGRASVAPFVELKDRA